MFIKTGNMARDGQVRVTTATTPRPPRWAGFAEAQRYAAVGRTKFRRMIDDGQIAAVKAGGKLIIDLSTIDQLYEGLPRIGPRNLTAADIGLAPEPNASNAVADVMKWV